MTLTLIPNNFGGDTDFWLAGRATNMKILAIASARYADTQRPRMHEILRRPLYDAERTENTAEIISTVIQACEVVYAVVKQQVMYIRYRDSYRRLRESGLAEEEINVSLPWATPVFYELDMRHMSLFAAVLEEMQSWRDARLKQEQEYHNASHWASATPFAQFNWTEYVHEFTAYYAEYARR